MQYSWFVTDKASKELSDEIAVMMELTRMKAPLFESLTIESGSIENLVKRGMK